jgi:CubicO group peptidase (beta-lactamase class C family)
MTESRRALGAAAAVMLLAAPIATFAQWRVTGQDVPQLAAFDAAMNGLMTNHNITSGQLALVWQGRLVLARGYSFNPGPSDLVTQPDSLFRIASLAKPITSTLVNRLIQEGRLSLDRRVADFVDLTPAPGQAADPRLASITIRNLLEHLGGFDIDLLRFDPMFHDAAIASALRVPLPVGRTDIIRYMGGVGLSHDPGTTFVYSNYGYLLLGRVIEKITGKSYDQYATSTLLGPLGIRNMRLGRSESGLRAPGEVSYLSGFTGTTVMDGSGRVVPYPYGWFNLENMDSHGGWIASAVELARWLANLDNPNALNAVLDQSSLDRMFSLPQNYSTPYTSGAYYYAKGWNVRDYGGGRRNTWHDGSLPGTTAYAVRLSTGFDYVVLLNRRDETGTTNYASEIDSAMAGVYLQTAQWPSHDLFPALRFPRDGDLGALTGLWWNPNESGWGIHFTQRRDTIFAAWYTYDASGNPKWYVASNCAMPPGTTGASGTCTGTLYEVAGPGFFGTTFNPAAVNARTAGSLQVAFQNAGSASMTYTLAGQTRTVPITRQVLAGTRPPGVNYTDLWWNPGESGWGMAIAHEGAVMFLAWYVYDSAGKPVWYVASNCAVSADACAGPLYRTTGPPFGPTFDPSRVQVSVAGTVSLAFTDPNNGTLTYTVDGQASSKTITRQVF